MAPKHHPAPLSGGDRKGIFKRHRDAHMAEIKARPRKPARPETMAKLEAVFEHAKKT